MNPHTFEEELGCGFSSDALLASCQYGHLREAIHDHKYTVITKLG
jgi:hypothetical protein